VLSLFFVLSHKSEILPRLNRGELKYLQFEIGDVTKTVCEAHEPADFFVESLGGSITNRSKVQWVIISGNFSLIDLSLATNSLLPVWEASVAHRLNAALASKAFFAVA